MGLIRTGGSSIKKSRNIFCFQDFLRSIPGSLLCCELHEEWTDVLDEEVEEEEQVQDIKRCTHSHTPYYTFPSRLIHGAEAYSLLLLPAEWSPACLKRTPSCCATCWPCCMGSRPMPRRTRWPVSIYQCALLPACSGLLELLAALRQREKEPRR